VRRVTLRAPGFVVLDAVPLQGAWWPARGPLQPAPAPPPPREDTVVGADVAVGLTVADDATRAAARVVLTPLRGALDDLTLTVVGLPADIADLQIDAPPHVRVTVDPDRARGATTLTLDLDARSAAPLALGLTWTTPLPPGLVASIAVPRVEVPDALRVQRALLVAREQGLSLAPDLRGGASVLPENLPDDARSLVSGTPVLAREGDATGTIQALRVAAAPSPPLFVDVADWRAVVTPEGRWVAQGRLTVRNERAAALDLLLPDGVTLASVVVDGRPTAVTLLPDRRVRIPLPRSVETVSGALAFPVEIGVRGQTAAVVGRHATWDVALPAPDAPIAVRRVTAHLPRGWQDAGRPGDGGQVDAFTEGDALAWTFGGGDLDEDAAEGLYRGAVDAWLRNDLSGAQGLLDTLRTGGVDNAQVVQLQDNLDAFGTKDVGRDGEASEDSAAVARVREFAQARAMDDARKQADALDLAEQAAAEGDYAKAEAALAKVAETSTRLRAIEAPQMARQEAVAYEFEALQEEVITKKADQASRTERKATPTFAGAPAPAAPLAAAEPAPEPADLPSRGSAPTGTVPDTRPVIATRAELSIPDHGAAVHFQHTLIPEGDRSPLTLTALAPRR
jgi:hypothetical protein